MGGVAASSDVFRAVADPTRRALLDRLRKSDLTVKELARPFRMTQPAISQHLRILRRAGLVRVRRAGQRRVYRMNPRPVERVYEWAARYARISDPWGHLWTLASLPEPGVDRPVSNSRTQTNPQKRRQPMAIKGARPNNRQVVPYLFVREGEQAIQFYQRAFGAQVLYRSAMPGSRGIFAQLKIADSVIQLADETLDQPRDKDAPASPQSLGGTSVVLEMYVDDVDSAYKRAVDAGATPTMPPMDTFFGDRYGWVMDPFGHTWALATVKEELTPEEIARRLDEMLAESGKTR